MTANEYFGDWVDVIDKEDLKIGYESQHTEED